LHAGRLAPPGEVRTIYWGTYLVVRTESVHRPHAGDNHGDISATWPLRLRHRRRDGRGERQVEGPDPLGARGPRGAPVRRTASGPARGQREDADPASTGDGGGRAGPP